MSTTNNATSIFASPLSSTPDSFPQRQRIGVEDSAENLARTIRSEFRGLNELWNRVHMDMPTREHRAQQASEYVHNLLRDIRSSEEEMIRSVVADLEARREAVSNLRKFLALPSFEESLYPPDSIALLKALDTEMNRLVVKREEFVGRQMTLYEKYCALCVQTGTMAHSVEGVHDRVLTEAELGKLNDEIKTVRSLFNKRLEKALQLQAESKRIYESIQLPANNSIGEDDLHCLRIDLHNHSVVLSSDVLKKMGAINQRLKDHYDAWIEQVAFRYDELIVKLDDLATKCYRPPLSTEYPSKPNLKLLNESQLQSLEEEVRARQEVYERAKLVFDKLNEWMASWKQKLDTERRVCRASFYKNRAGSLNTKLKQRKMVEQKVPKLLDELHELCDEYVKQFRVDDIVIDGKRADLYAKSVMQGYQQDREVQKAQKQFSTPTRPTTPGRSATSSASRRNVFGCATMAAGRTAVRALKLHGDRQQQPLQATPSHKFGEGMRGTRKRSFSCSQLSAILPLTSPMMGPRTSSPKPDECS
ncbi:hypothetical protein GPALN_003545 [Globodera pallida]|nr:hypothetical protein GPALN_003545 [Globodera pallida]